MPENEPKLCKERYKNSFESFLGVDFVKYCDSYCELSLVIRPELCNIGGSTHGGVIESLLDMALSGAVTCDYMDKPETVVTLQMNVNFLRPSFPGDTLIAWGEVVKKGRTVCFVEGGIKTPEGKLIAKASGDWFIKKPSHPNHPDQRKKS